MSSRFEEIALAKLAPHPQNIRVDVGDVTELAASIEAKGILQPLVVAPHPTAKEKYVLLAGHRRHAAAKRAKLKSVPCTVRDDLTDPATQLETMLVENLHRADLSVLEESDAYQALLEFPNYDAKHIAKSTGRSSRTVSDRIKLGKVPHHVKKKLLNHQVTLEQAMVFADFADDAEATAALTKNLGSYNWDYTVREAKQDKTARAKIPKTLKELKAAGVTVIDRPEGHLYSSDYRPLGHYHSGEHKIEELIAAKYVAIVDVGSRGLPYWVIHIDNAPEPTAGHARQLMDEEKAAAAERARIEAGLAVAGQVRAERIADVLKAPADDAAKTALVLHLMGTTVPTSRHDDYGPQRATKALAAVLQLSEKASANDVELALHSKSLAQVAILTLLLHDSKEDELDDLRTWSPTWYAAPRTTAWREALAYVFDYELCDIEREAIAFHNPKPTEGGGGDGDD